MTCIQNLKRWFRFYNRPREIASMIDIKNNLPPAVLIETDVPVPPGRQNEKEPLPDLPLKQMYPGQSFLIPTTDGNHTRRRLSAVRSAIRRFNQVNNPVNNFRVFIWKDEESNQQGVRVFCVGEDEDSDQ